MPAYLMKPSACWLRPEQRNNELAIINTIQQGLAAELDFQSIVDLVGDKLRQVFNVHGYWYYLV